jgi:tetratricopeptide (TPR) repeat protein
MDELCAPHDDMPDQDKLDEAEKMFRQALEGKEKALGINHTSTLGTVNNLGLLYAGQGKLEEAKEMFRRALEG